MKKLTFVLAVCMLVSLLAGCAGTPVVYYSDCTCPADSHNTPVTPNENGETPVTTEGSVKTGLAVVAKATPTDAAADADGKAEFDVTLAAVLVDDEGVIVDCTFDSIGETVTFDTTGAITSDVSAEVRTKTEKGYDYGMVAYQASTMEWFEQAEALAQYAIGKTVEELKNGAVGETGYAQDADLATSATIYLGGYVSAIEAAVANAQHLGAQAGDELILTSINKLTSSAAGNAQLDCDVTALTMKEDVITSCVIDGLQAKVAIDENGVASVANTLSKNDLGYDYGMVKYQASTMEWFEQAASFAAYVTGKTPAEVAGIAVTETTAPADADLAASVTIAIGGFQALIAKAAQ